MFLNNKYKGWYYQIINRARKRGVPEGYFERHHVIPKCMGGSDIFWNIVNLTIREHYIAHWLLTKMVIKEYKRKMLFGLSRMSELGPKQKRIIAAWQYEQSRKASREAQVGVKLAPETIRKMIESNKGYKHSKETKLKMAKSPRFSGHRHTLESKLKMARPGIKLSEDHKRKIGLGNKGKKRRLGAMDKANEARKIISKEFAFKISPIMKEIQALGITSLYGIANQLNNWGIPTLRGGESKWHTHTVKQILMDE